MQDVVDNSEFWKRVNDQLDERRDPLDDAVVTAHLSAHPESLEEFAELVSAVSSLARDPAAPRRTASGPRHIAAVVAVMLVGTGLALGGWHLLGSTPIAPETESKIVLPDLAVDGEVLGYSSRSYTRGPDGQVEHQVEALTVAIHERELRTRVQLGVSTPHGHSIRTELSHLSSRIRPEQFTN